MSAGERIDRLVGVYHARGTFWGEVSYWVRARFGGGHCALCDITHGAVREKAEWRECRAALPVEFTTLHLDEQDTDLEAFTAGRTPCVVAETASGYRMLVTSEELASCEGSPERLVSQIEAGATRAGLSLG